MRQCLDSVSDAPMRPAKVFNFLFHGGFGPFYFYQGVLLTRRGLPSSLIGAVLGVRPVVSIVVPAAWTAAADHFGWHRSLLIFGLIVGSSSRILYGIAPTDATSMMAMAIISESLICHVVPLADAAVFLGLSRLDRPLEDFAQQRLWGAIGAGLLLPITGMLLTASPHAAAWTIVLGVHMGTLWLNAWVVPTLCSIGKDIQATTSTTPRDKSTTTSKCCALFREMRVSPRGAARTLLLFCCGAFHAVTEGFLFIYLEALGAPELLCGLAITFTCTSETAVMNYSPLLMKRLGVDMCLVLVLAGYTLRFFGYACLPGWGTWAVLPFQLLHGLTFGLYWTVGTTLAAKCAPKGREATLQGAFTTLVSVGQTLALVLGGRLFEMHGGDKLYAGACIAAAGVLLVALSLVLSLPRRQSMPALVSAGDLRSHELEAVGP